MRLQMYTIVQQDNEDPENIIIVNNFVSDVIDFNEFYNLQSILLVPGLSPYSQTEPIASLDEVKLRLIQFSLIFLEEVNEVQDLMKELSSIKDDENSYEARLNFAVNLADWFADLIVYVTSEAIRFNIPLAHVLQLVMISNFSKLDKNGKPIIKDGKIMKGPDFKPPEPEIKKLFEEFASALRKQQAEN